MSGKFLNYETSYQIVSLKKLDPHFLRNDGVRVNSIICSKIDSQEFLTFFLSGKKFFK